MAMQSEKTGGLKLSGGSPGVAATEKPKGQEELGLCLALVVLLAWALFVAVRAVDWSAVSHTFGVLLAWFR
ncbi:MAG: hypothetical protein WB819_17460 [Terriglobia bacterium]|jgi:hypothetical protein